MEFKIGDIVMLRNSAETSRYGPLVKNTQYRVALTDCPKKTHCTNATPLFLSNMDGTPVQTGGCRGLWCMHEFIQYLVKHRMNKVKINNKCASK